MKKIIALVVVVIIVVSGLGYLGYIPGIASLFGWNSPRDLGVKAGIADYNSASEKLGRERLELPQGSNGDSIVFEGSHPIDASFTQEEMTATWQTRDYEGNPFSNAGQIKINEDNTVETSGALDIELLLETIEKTVVIDEETRALIDKAGFIKGDVPFYVKVNMAVTDGNWDINFQEAKLGFASIPVDQLPVDTLEDAARMAVDSIAGFSIESLTVERNKL